MTNKLEARISRTSEKIINDNELLNDLLRAFSSPLNLVFPLEVGPNLINFYEVFKKNKIISRVSFANKANSSRSILRQLSLSGACVDVASLKELKDALSCGFTPDRIEVTGPKNWDLLLLAVQISCTINIDNIEELVSVVKISNSINLKKIDILLRINSFTLNSSKYLDKDSRFGLNRDDLIKAAEIIKGASVINFRGFSFHLDSGSIEQKVVAIETCLDLMREDFLKDFSLDVLNIGGGFKLNYLKSEGDWEEFINHLKDSAITRESVTWNNYSHYGFYNDRGVLRGSFNNYEYYNDVFGAKYLDELLNFKSQKYGKSISELISDSALNLWIEPGRSLLDGAGISVARVSFVKRSAKNEVLIGLDMKRSDLAFIDQDFLVDPIIVRKDSEGSEVSDAYFIGNLCLESDFIFKRKVKINASVKQGDIVVFPNTAAYNMDFSSADSIKQNKAKKIAIKDVNDKLLWYEDDNYQVELIT